MTLKMIGRFWYSAMRCIFFYVYQPPRSLEAIDADLDEVTQRILALLQEVHL